MTALTVLLIGLLAAPMTGSAPKDKKYGKPVTVKEKTSVSAILAEPKSFHGKTVRIEGLVVEVCAKRGCWIKVAGEKDGETITFKVEDGVITFPMESKGKTAVAQGVVNVTVQTAEQQIEAGKHQAEEQGTTFDPSTVKGPKTAIRIDGEGAVIR